MQKISNLHKDNGRVIKESFCQLHMIHKEIP